MSNIVPERLSGLIRETRSANSTMKDRLPNEDASRPQSKVPKRRPFFLWILPPRLSIHLSNANAKALLPLRPAPKTRPQSFQTSRLGLVHHHRQHRAALLHPFKNGDQSSRYSRSNSNRARPPKKPSQNEATMRKAHRSQHQERSRWYRCN